MHAHNVFGAFGSRGNFVNVEGGGVRRENGARLAHFIQLGEDLFLDGHVLKDGFNHQVDVAEVIVAQAGFDQPHALFHLLGGELAFSGRVLVIAANDCHSAIQGFLLNFNDGGRNAHIGKVHGDSSTHGAGTDNAHTLHLTHRRVLGQTFDLGNLTLGKERMDQACTLR